MRVAVFLGMAVELGVGASPDSPLTWGLSALPSSFELVVPCEFANQFMEWQ